MSLALLQSTLLLPVEQMLNVLLALDTATAARLRRLDGNALAVRATAPTIDVFIAVRGDRLHLSALWDSPVRASLHGSTSALLRLLAHRGSVDTLQALGVELRGDAGFVQELRSVLLALDVDWEYHFSKLAGDIPTQALASGLREMSSFLRKTGARLREDLDEYLHEEARLLPTAAELDTFYTAIEELRLRADRLRARVDALAVSKDL
jgi:ubiquinone biosynthesis accessory factor UbiJ